MNDSSTVAPVRDWGPSLLGDVSVWICTLIGAGVMVLRGAALSTVYGGPVVARVIGAGVVGLAGGFFLGLSVHWLRRRWKRTVFGRQLARRYLIARSAELDRLDVPKHERKRMAWKRVRKAEREAVDGTKASWTKAFNKGLALEKIAFHHVVNAREPREATTGPTLEEAAMRARLERECLQTLEQDLDRCGMGADNRQELARDIVDAAYTMAASDPAMSLRAAFVATLQREQEVIRPSVDAGARFRARAPKAAHPPPAAAPYQTPDKWMRTKDIRVELEREFLQVLGGDLDACGVGTADQKRMARLVVGTAEEEARRRPSLSLRAAFGTQLKAKKNALEELRRALGTADPDPSTLRHAIEELAGEHNTDASTLTNVERARLFRTAAKDRLDGLELLAKGDYAEAERRLNRARRTFLGLRETEGVAGVLIALAQLARTRGRFTSAKEQYDRALDAYTELNKHGQRALTLGELGDLHAEHGNAAAARAYRARALALLTEAGEREGEEAQRLMKLLDGTV